MYMFSNSKVSKKFSGFVFLVTCRGLKFDIIQGPPKALGCWTVIYTSVRIRDMYFSYWRPLNGFFSGFNSLGDRVSSTLMGIISRLPLLEHLELASCHFTSEFFNQVISSILFCKVSLTIREIFLISYISIFFCYWKLVKLVIFKIALIFFKTGN
jgi:hypothetical protein